MSQDSTDDVPMTDGAIVRGGPAMRDLKSLHNYDSKYFAPRVVGGRRVVQPTRAATAVEGKVQKRKHKRKHNKRSKKARRARVQKKRKAQAIVRSDAPVSEAGTQTRAADRSSENEEYVREYLLSSSGDEDDVVVEEVVASLAGMRTGQLPQQVALVANPPGSGQPHASAPAVPVPRQASAPAPAPQGQQTVYTRGSDIALAREIRERVNQIYADIGRIKETMDHFLDNEIVDRDINLLIHNLRLEDSHMRQISAVLDARDQANRLALYRAHLSAAGL